MSMPAPNLETLFSVEPAVEGAWKRLLAAEDIKAFTQRETEQLPLDRVDIQLRLGAHTGHRHADRAGQHFLDAWNAQLVLQLTSPRVAIDPSGEHATAAAPSEDDRHNALRARIRILAQYASGRLGEAALPFHALTKIQEAGTAPSVTTLDDCDVSEITFDCLVSIRASAWPLLP